MKILKISLFLMLTVFFTEISKSQTCFGQFTSGQVTITNNTSYDMAVSLHTGDDCCNDWAGYAGVVPSGVLNMTVPLVSTHTIWGVSPYGTLITATANVVNAPNCASTPKAQISNYGCAGPQVGQIYCNSILTGLVNISITGPLSITIN